MHPETFDTVWDSTNDYSYAELVSFEDDNDAAAITELITLYADDELIWGVEPDGTKPEDAPSQPSTQKPTTTPAAPSGKVLYGDANCDGKVTIADSTAILQAIGNSDEFVLSAQGEINADCCNVGDGVTAADALSIQKLDAALIEKLPETIK